MKVICEQILCKHNQDKCCTIDKLELKMYDCGDGGILPDYGVACSYAYYDNITHKQYKEIMQKLNETYDKKEKTA